MPVQLAPVRVTLEGAATAGDPWTLFDSDATRGLRAHEPVAVRVAMGTPRLFAGLTVFGHAGGRLTVRAEREGRREVVPGLENVALDGASGPDGRRRRAHRGIAARVAPEPVV
jgi:hypothetical protein